MKIDELNNDQIKVILALAHPEQFYRGFHTATGVRGVPYKKIMEISKLSIEKTLLSIGWLEAKDIVKHDVVVVEVGNVLVMNHILFLLKSVEKEGVFELL